MKHTKENSIATSNDVPAFTTVTSYERANIIKGKQIFFSLEDARGVLALIAADDTTSVIALMNNIAESVLNIQGPSTAAEDLLSKFSNLVKEEPLGRIGL
jgi:aspartyl-tRNA synthetase